MIKEFDEIDGIKLDDTYSITHEGEIRNGAGRKRKFTLSVLGRMRIPLRTIERVYRDFYLSRILYQVFIGTIPTGLTVDHINRNKADNRLENLRLATQGQQNWNQNKKGKTTYKGVTFDPVNNRWRARATYNYKEIWLGRFDTELEAAIAYDLFALKHFGEFAATNLIHRASSLEQQ